MVNLEYLYDINTHIGIQEKNKFYFNSNLGYKTYKNGYILPKFKDKDNHDYDGVWSENKVYDKTSGHNAAVNDVYNFERVFPNLDVKKINEKVIFIGNFSGCWGHFITDSIRQLWFLKTNIFTEKYKTYKKVFVSWAGFKIQGNFKKLLEYFGIDTKEIFEITEPTQFEQVVLPDSSFVCNMGLDCRLFHAEYVKTIDFIIESVNPKLNRQYDKVYYSCAHKKARGAIGEEKLEKFFQSKGFEIIYPERCSFEKQIEIMNSCTVFASTDGSSMHNCIFAKNPITLLIIPRAAYSSGYQETLNFVRNFNCFYIDSNLSVLTKYPTPHSGKFYYYVSDKLLDFFKEKKSKTYIKDNFYDIEKYIKISSYESINDNFFATETLSKLFFHYYSLHIKSKKFSFFIFKLFRKIKIRLDLFMNKLKKH